ncbi:hypothetical protein VVD49_16395 [Uliginosibacterium sp. H3]|uniref:Transposase n=1 Tax=Uliginosibacterium silvisoli TaxID=3114758 RepID=A0ABU6K7A3_9RHOO|nr:hypothetical protein [Uliginosibacterium sp. H3]
MLNVTRLLTGQNQISIARLWRCLYVHAIRDWRCFGKEAPLLSDVAYQKTSHNWWYEALGHPMGKRPGAFTPEIDAFFHSGSSAGRILAMIVLLEKDHSWAVGYCSKRALN